MITLRRTKGAFPKLIGRRQSRPAIKRRQTSGYTRQGHDPGATLAEGTYYVRACANYGSKTLLENPTGGLPLSRSAG